MLVRMEFDSGLDETGLKQKLSEVRSVESMIVSRLDGIRRHRMDSLKKELDLRIMRDTGD